MISRPKSLYLHIRLPAALPAGIISESMQERHENAGRYFDECARTCARYYLPWLKYRLAKPLGDACRVLEAGCDKGGNLKPFAEAGCRVVGILYVLAISISMSISASFWKQLKDNVE